MTFWASMEDTPDGSWNDEADLGEGMSEGTVLFINTRSSFVEAEACYVAAKMLGLDVILLSDALPSVPAGYIKESLLVNTYDHGELLNAARQVSRRNSVCGVVCWGDRDV